jgi:hypothetical protein
MRRHVTPGLAAAAAVGLTLAASSAPAAARTGGPESFKGAIVATGQSGARTVVDTVIAARGVFTGVGRIVEVPNRPGDPDAVSRDDLVFSRGAMHLVSTTVAATMSVDPKTCAFTAKIRQTARIRGGTRHFRHASGRFTGRVRARGVGARDAGGSCSEAQPPLLEVDVVKAKGHLSF